VAGHADDRRGDGFEGNEHRAGGVAGEDFQTVFEDGDRTVDEFSTGSRSSQGGAALAGMDGILVGGPQPVER
jgi:hypothetical protein